MQQTRRDWGVWLQPPGNGTAELPEQLPPSRVCIPSTQGESSEPGVKPGADPARARREQQQGKAEGAELSPGTRRVGRGRTRQALEKQEGNQIFACISSRNFANSFKTVPSTSSLSQAVMGRVGSTQRTITCGQPWRAEGDGGIVPGMGQGGSPGAAPTLRHATARGPPVCPFPNLNLGAKEDKDDPNTGNGSGPGLWGFILP